MTSDDVEPETSGDAAAASVGPAKRGRLSIWQESILLLGIALGLAVVLKTLLAQAFYIPSESMEPGLQGGPRAPVDDRILVQKVSYWFGRDPQRGDVVVFEDPGGWLTGGSEQPSGLANVLSRIGLYPTGGHLVKRVIGVEGDLIECCDEQGRILVNGEPVDESAYLAADQGRCAAAQRFTNEGCDWSIGPVPEGKLFVMGDNRDASADSRAHVCSDSVEACTDSPWVDTELVVGKAFALVWPQDRWAWIEGSEAFGQVPAGSD